MMDEQQRKQISDAIVEGGEAPTEEVASLLESDSDAKAYYDDLTALEAGLRGVEIEQPPRQYWKSFGGRVTSALGKEPGDDLDVTAAPLPDEDAELEAMRAVEPAGDAPAEEEDDDGGLGALAALAGRSTLPPASAIGERKVGASSDDVAVIDLGALKAESEKTEREKAKKQEEKAAAAAPAASKSEGATPAAPSAAPAAAPEQKSSTMMYVVGALVLALVAVAYFAMSSGADEGASAGAEDTVAQVRSAPGVSSEPSSPTPASAEAPAEPSPGASDVEPTNEADDEGAAGDESSDEPAASAAGGDDGAESAEGATEDRERSSHRRGHRREGRSHSERHASAPEPAPAKVAPATPAPAPARPAGSESPQKSAGADLDALLAGATGPAKSSKRASSGGSAADAVKAAVGGDSQASALPPQPSRSQVRRAMGSVAGQVMACRSLVQTQTRVNATVTVANSGAVQNANVSGGTPPVQQCVRRAVMRARFPRFQQATFSVTYPFVLSPPE